jgi:5'(3')-deoxyribonucleotidase
MATDSAVTSPVIANLTTAQKTLVVHDPNSATHAIKEAAVAEVAEKYYRKARDRYGLFKAIEIKLTNQRNFVLWWDTQANKWKGGDPGELGDGSVTQLKDFRLDKKTVSRWRKKLTGDDFDQVVAAAQANAVKFIEMNSDDAMRMLSSDSVEWYTPPHIITAAREVLGTIDLDPASNAKANKWTKAKRYFTEKTDGLTKNWHGKVWMNPPYSGMTPKFVGKLIDSYEIHGTVTEALCLVNATACKDNWLQPLFNYVLCFMQPLRFINEKGVVQVKAPFASCAVYFGDKPECFAEVFGKLGQVVRIWPPRNVA